jgi:hypothetical protein
MNNLIEKEYIQEKILTNLNTYVCKFGYDEFINGIHRSLLESKDKVFIVNVDAEKNSVISFIKNQTYKNIEVISMSNFISRIKNNEDLGAYVGFIEKDYIYEVTKISEMISDLCDSEDGMNICRRDIQTPHNRLLGNTALYKKWLSEVRFSGNNLIRISVEDHVNFYGSLSTILCKSDSIRKIDIKNINNKLTLFFEIILANSMHYIDKVLAIKKVNIYSHNIEAEKKNVFLKTLNKYISLGRLNIKPESANFYVNRNNIDVKKEITFFYTDRGEKFNLDPIAQYAENHGYKIKFSSNLKEKAEIGIYCQHMGYPENSKFSVVLLHDMAQGHNRWPNIWTGEPWDRYDIGVVPGRQWADRWAECASAMYVKPRYGVYAMGYPKGDTVFSDEIIKKATEIKKRLKYDFTVLYAPSWENDGKEDDFVKALVDLPINLIIKQAAASPHPAFQFFRENVAEMRLLHENKYDNLTYIEPEENILVALCVCDMVVSDESSVMTEAVLYGKPSLAITDWLIPDEKPHRYSSVPFDYVIKGTKETMREIVKELFTDKDMYKQACQLGKGFFANQGHASEYIVRLIDAFIENKKIDTELLAQKVLPKYELIDLW